MVRDLCYVVVVIIIIIIIIINDLFLLFSLSVCSLARVRTTFCN